MCYVVCRELDVNAVYVAPDSRHRFEIDPGRCLYPGCTVVPHVLPGARLHRRGRQRPLAGAAATGRVDTPTGAVARGAA